MISPARIAELRKLDEAATDAPWEHRPESRIRQAEICRAGLPDEVVLCPKNNHDLYVSAADMAVLLAARNALPELLDAVEEADRDFEFHNKITDIADNTARALAKMLGREYDRMTNYCCEAVFDLPDLCEEVEGQLDVQRWVSVTERLPEIIPSFINTGMPIHGIDREGVHAFCFHRGLGYFQANPDLRPFKPTHWRPLPPPPE